MQHSSPINATMILRAVATGDDLGALTTETDEHEQRRHFRYRLAVLEVALRRVEELRRKAALSKIQLRSWVADKILQDVPGEIAICEFDCRKTQCTFGEWERCKSRLRHL